MKNDFFYGFNDEYLFFDNDNDAVFVFDANYNVELMFGNDTAVYIGKWRFTQENRLIEIFIKELELTILYKLRVISTEKDTVILKVKFIYRYNYETKKDIKGQTMLIRSTNNRKKDTIKNENENENIKKISKWCAILIFCISFSTLFMIFQLFPFFGKAGILYNGAIVLIIQILLTSKIRKLSKFIVKKYEKQLNAFFFN